MNLKLVQISFHFEYTDAIEAILDHHAISDFVRYAMVEGKDRNGKHYGTQVFPGNVTVVQAQVAQERLNPLLDELRHFRESKPAHAHLQAVVLPIERRL